MKNKRPDTPHLGEFEELVLLAAGQLGAKATSVGIQDVLLERAGRDAALGAIYAALDRLERKRCAESWLAVSTPTRGGRRKRHYALTDRGRQALAESRRVRELLWRRLPRSTSR